MIIFLLLSSEQFTILNTLHALHGKLKIFPSLSHINKCNYSRGKHTNYANPGNCNCLQGVEIFVIRSAQRSSHT